jgi:hypothetical protein
MTAPPLPRAAYHVLPVVARLALITSALALLVFPPDAAATDRCHLPRGAHVLARSRIALVYRVDIDRLEGGAKRLKYLACVRSTGERVTLNIGGTGPDPGVSRLFIFSGWLVAFASEYKNHYGESGSDVLVFDLRTRRQRYSIFAGNEFAGPYPDAHLESLALAASGMTAWVVPLKGVPQLLTASPAGAGPLTLDSGDGIDPQSLKVLGSTVTWIKNGARQYATPFATPASPLIERRGDHGTTSRSADPH